MTKDEWQEAERRALWKYGGLTLLVDGYKISVQRQYATPYKSKLAVYANGTFRGKWLVEDCEERRRFCYCVKHSLIKKNCPENKKKVVFEGDGQKRGRLRLLYLQPVLSKFCRPATAACEKQPRHTAYYGGMTYGKTESDNRARAGKLGGNRQSAAGHPRMPAHAGVTGSGARPKN